MEGFSAEAIGLIQLKTHLEGAIETIMKYELTIEDTHEYKAMQDIFVFLKEFMTYQEDEEMEPESNGENNQTINTIMTALDNLSKEISAIKQLQVQGKMPTTEIDVEEGLQQSIHAPSATWVKSNNPKPISPKKKETKAAQSNPFSRATPTRPTQRNHPSRLIMNLSPEVNAKNIAPGNILKHRINNTLTELGIEKHIRVKGVIMSVEKAKPIVIAADTCTAADLNTPSIIGVIASAIRNNDEMEDESYAREDMTWFQIRIDNVPTKDHTDEIFDPQSIRQILNESLDMEMDLACEPRWLIKQDQIETRYRGSVLLSFKNEEQARKVLKSKTALFDGAPVRFNIFEERRRNVQCTDCGLWSHRMGSPACKGPRCRHCTGTAHTTDEHGENDPLLCGHCNGTHSADNCDVSQKPRARARTADGQLKSSIRPKRAKKTKTTDKDGFTQVTSGTPRANSQPQGQDENTDMNDF